MIEAVRVLTAHDATAVAELEARARAELVQQRGGPVHLSEHPVVGEWAPLVDRADRAVWVATYDDLVVGYLELALRDDGTAEVLQVYVRPEARQLGFGDWLLEAALAHARSSGCTALEGTALPGDRDTKNLYERAGITARRITLWKAL
ncbi:MAG: GNAT family N-acetyltransferase [Actinomycetota bacterium]|nr:GNAT family N-acetyltransferase [Actinomycetota bacterium]